MLFVNAQSPLGLLWQQRILKGSSRLPRAEKACANFSQANLRCSLEADPRHTDPLPFVFHAKEIHEPGHREHFPDQPRSRNCTAAAVETRRQQLGTPLTALCQITAEKFSHTWTPPPKCMRELEIQKNPRRGQTYRG